MRWTIFVALCLAGPASAQLYCSPPSKPYCAEGWGRFETEWEFDACRSEVEFYRQAMRRYLACLAEESDSSVRAFNNVIESFNRRATAGR